MFPISLAEIITSPPVRSTAELGCYLLDKNRTETGLNKDPYFISKPINRTKLHHRAQIGNHLNNRVYESVKILLNIIFKLVLTVSVTASAISAMAQLPELSLPSSISGASTTARFFGGASSDNGASFASSFDYDQQIDIASYLFYMNYFCQSFFKGHVLSNLK